MENIFLYHGSDHTIEKPIYGYGNHNNDYGLGFYCTTELYTAKEWANKNITSGIVNKYSLSLVGLNVLDLTDKNKYSVLNWIAILMHFRVLKNSFRLTHKIELQYLEDNYYIDVFKYDLVIGFRADDSYFEFPLLFIDNQLRLESLTEIFELGHLGVQHVLIVSYYENNFKHKKLVKKHFQN